MTRGRISPGGITWGPWGITPGGSTLGGSIAPGKKKPRYNRGESVTGANDAPGWGYRAAVPLREGERERSRRTCVIRHPTPREVPHQKVRRQVAAPWHACDHLFNGGRKRVPGRARRALCNKSHKEQYVTNCIINTPRVGYFLTGVTVPQAASGFWGVCPHLIHRDIHRICGRLGRTRNDRALSRSAESLRKFVSASYAPLCVSFAALRQWRTRTVTSQVLVTQVGITVRQLPQGISAGRGPAAVPLPFPASR